MLIHVLQGERERAQDNWSLGRFTLDFGSRAAGCGPRWGAIRDDANGILHVLAATPNRQQKIVEMKSAVDVDDASRAENVEDPSNTLFEDWPRGGGSKPGSRPIQLISATRKALMDGADEIQDDYRIQLEAALHAVEAAALEDPKTKPVIPGSFKPRARRWMRSPNLWPKS